MRAAQCGHANAKRVAKARKGSFTARFPSEWSGMMTVYSTAQYSTAQYGSSQRYEAGKAFHSALYCTIPYRAYCTIVNGIELSIVQYSTVQYSTAQHLVGNDPAEPHGVRLRNAVIEGFTDGR
jgi:hypothetical protein